MVITAKYAGRCKKCGGHIAVGDKIDWERGQGATHVSCPAAQKTDAATGTEKTDAPYHVGGGSGYGYSAYTVGQTIAVDTSLPRYKKYPAYLTVVDCGQNYYADEGMSFGVGDESGYTYWAKCREASDVETQPLRKIAAKRTARNQAKNDLAEIENDFDQAENYAEGTGHNPQGERLMDSQNIYGSGDWWIINDTEIWHVCNHGMDGDDWSRNNVRTGGAGAVGYRVPRDEKTVSRLHEIAKTLAE